MTNSSNNKAKNIDQENVALPPGNKGSFGQNTIHTYFVLLSRQKCLKMLHKIFYRTHEVRRTIG